MMTGSGQVLQHDKRFLIYHAGRRGKDVFVHVTAVQAVGLGGLNEGQHVQFDIEPDKRGPKAVNLQLV